MLCLWGILTFLFFLAALSLNLGLQVLLYHITMICSMCTTIRLGCAAVDIMRYHDSSAERR